MITQLPLARMAQGAAGLSAVHMQGDVAVLEPGYWRRRLPASQRTRPAALAEQSAPGAALGRAKLPGKPEQSRRAAHRG